MREMRKKISEAESSDSNDSQDDVLPPRKFLLDKIKYL